MRIGVLLLLSTGLLLGSGCALVLGFEDTTLRPESADGGSDDTFDGGADAATDGAAARLSAQPSDVVLRQGGTADVTVTIVRGGDLVGPVAITVSDLPPGVTVAPATIRDRETTAKVTFSAAANAPFGTFPAKLSIDKGSLAPIPLSILVAGVPGTPDTTFDGDGFVVDGTKGNNATFYALAVQPDGKIVAGGAGGTGSAGWFVRRFGGDGAADKAFTTALGTLPNDGEVRAVALDPTTSKILIAGTSSPGVGITQLTVMRRETTGAPDNTFAGGAFRFTLLDAPLGSTAYALAVQPDGTIIVAGTRRENLGKTSGIALRLKKDGTRDMTFNGGNVVVVADNDFVGVAPGPAGSMFVAGTDASAQLGSFYLTKRLVTGLPDNTFGTGGVKTFGLGFRAHGFVRMPDGSLVVGGESAQSGNIYALGRTDAAGGQVFARSIATATGASFNAVTADASGRIVAAGNSTGASAEARVSRVQLDGTVDATFGTAGSALVTATTLNAAAMQKDGRILVAGSRAAAGGIVYRIWP